MIIDTDKIKDLLASDITGYRVAQLTNVKQPVYFRYQKGQTPLENMTLKVASELMRLLQKKEGIMMTVKNIDEAVEESFNSLNGFYFWNTDTNVVDFQPTMPNSGPGDNYFNDNEYLLCWIDESDSAKKRKEKINVAIESLIITNYQFTSIS